MQVSITQSLLVDPLEAYSIEEQSIALVERSVAKSLPMRLLHRGKERKYITMIMN